MRSRTHGQTGTPFYRVWTSMLSRCRSDTPRYGGRGITVCERWHRFEAFREDMGPTYQPGLQLDRRDNDGHYSPENCRWVTRKVNNRNRSTTPMVVLDGKRMALADAAEAVGIHLDTLHDRLQRGLTQATGLFAPAVKKDLRRTRVSEQIAALRLQRVSVDEIARQFGIHRNTVLRHGTGLGRWPKKEA